MGTSCSMTTSFGALLLLVLSAGKMAIVRKVHRGKRACAKNVLSWACRTDSLSNLCGKWAFGARIT